MGGVGWIHLISFDNGQVVGFWGGAGSMEGGNSQNDDPYLGGDGEVRGL